MLHNLNTADIDSTPNAEKRDEGWENTAISNTENKFSNTSPAKANFLAKSHRVEVEWMDVNN
jgi:hypothetical protein